MTLWVIRLSSIAIYIYDSSVVTFLQCCHDLQVHDLASEELLEGGQVMWEDRNEQQVSPDYLMFHPDDSNKLIHIRTSKIRYVFIRFLSLYSYVYC